MPPPSRCTGRRSASFAASWAKHSLLAATLSSLAACCSSPRRLRRRRAAHRQALETRQRYPVPPADVATSAHNLAQLYRPMGSYAAQSRVLSRRWPSVVRPWDPVTRKWPIRWRIARLYLAIGDAAAAEAPLDQALRIRRAALGSEHPSAVASLCALAELRVRETTAAEVF